MVFFIRMLKNTVVLDNESRVSIDPIRKCLEERGFDVSTSWLFDQPSLNIVNGTRIYIKRSEIVYKYINDDTILIVLYRKEKSKRNSLSFSLVGLFWFIRFVAENFPNVYYFTGLIDVYPYLEDQGINTNRLAALYSRFGAEVFWLNDRLWVKLDVRTFDPGRY